MKKTLFAGIATLALVGAASAADLPRQMPVKAAPLAPVYDWNGFYIGGYYGTSIGHSRATSSEIGGAVEPNDTGITGGLTLGYNWHFSPNGLLGIEGDVGYLGTKRSFQFVDEPSSAGVKSTWYSTVRGRLGYVTGPSLLYVTGGGAWVRLEETFGGDIGVAPTTIKKSDTGWAVGGGIETKLSRSWTAKTEYLYLDLGSDSFGATTFHGDEIVTFKNRFHVIKTGLNYKFGEPFELPFMLAPLSSPQRWAGFYAGVNAGGGLSLVRTPSQTFPLNPGEADVNGGGFAGGGQIGYNWVPFSNWIVGLEGDIGYLGIRHAVADWYNTGTNGRLYQPGISTDWYGTVRGRIGTATGPAFLYATGGAAFVHFKDTLNYDGTLYASEKTKAGWTFGGGIETELNSRWSARLEALYIDVGRATVSSPDGSTEFKNRFQVIRAGLNYRFGGPDVVTARY
jgi:outer membrane immunogenic protein